VKPAPFDYHVPASAKEAVELLAELGDGAKLIAGGQSLIPLLALRLAAFEHLIDVSRLAELRGIHRRDDIGPAWADDVPAVAGAGPGIGQPGRSVWIGAGTTEAAIGRSPLVAADVPLLARATPLIGHFQIRNRGTIGGSLAHADAAAEYPAVALALDAVIQTLSPRGQRSIPAAEFFTGIWSTALEPDELLTGVSFATPAGPAGFAIEEFARRPGDFAVAGAAVAIELEPEGEVDAPASTGRGAGSAGPAVARPGAGRPVRRCRIALFGLGPTPRRAAAAESAVRGAPAGDAATDARARDIGRAAMADLDSVPSDLHGPAAYRTRVGAALVAAAWRRAIEEAIAAAPRPARDEEAAGG
jgi:aerobic carbon-monoxide dehydrogenase medium subunit